MTIETVKYRGFKIEIDQDQFAENPRKAWEGNAPMITCGLRETVTEYDGANDIADFFARVSIGWVSRHWRKIAGILEMDSAEFDADCKEEQADHGGGMGDIRADLFREHLDGMKPGYYSSASGYFQALESLYTLAGYVCLHSTATGFCQGDHIDALLVSTPEHRKFCAGDSKWNETKESLQKAAELFEAWAFGYVYGYSIEGKSGETLDSCCGFYGYDHDESGLMVEAKSNIDAHISFKRKERFDRLKDLIRNRVPLGLRNGIAGEFA